MPASLSNQVRLGFSLGWRIWTPNEVGFYAKTLAHSYFIFTILRSKFLKKKIWIINYSIFIASMKYLVFVEFIEFGIKSKEERCYWKKIMYISLLIRHQKYRSKTKYTPNFEKMKLVTRFFNELDRSDIHSVEEKESIAEKYAPIVATKFSKIKRVGYGARILRKVAMAEDDLNSKTILEDNREEKDVEPYVEPENSEEYRQVAESVTAANLKNFVEKTPLKYKWTYLKYGWKKFKRLRRIRKRNPRIIVRKRNLKNIPVSLRGTLANIAPEYIYPAIVGGTNSEILGRRVRNSKRKSISFKKIRLDGASLTSRLRFRDQARKNMINMKNELETSFPDSEVMSEVRTELLFGIEKLTLKRRKAAVFSIAGGPRKRLFRNIKRSFQGKYIVQYASLVWFWEKVSKLITYIIKRLTAKKRKKIFNV